MVPRTPPGARIESFFVTEIYRARLLRRAAALNADLEAACRSVAAEDTAGQRWCIENHYKGYTSYASLNDLPWRASVFAELVTHLDTHVRSFAHTLEFDIDPRRLGLDSLWINVLAPGGQHAAHIHPHSVISGTYYVRVPEGAAAIRYEDPRLPMMMAAPARRPKARREHRTFMSLEPESGMVLLWESWLRHEVPANRGKSERISISFNYAVR